MLQGESHILHIQSWITIQVKGGFSEENPFPPQSCGNWKL